MANDGILVVCAHPDDHILGPGGTLSKYTDEGKKAIVIIASYGEGSHLWLKPQVTRKFRKAEAEKSSKMVGVKQTTILGLQEGKVTEDIDKHEKFIKEIIKKNKIRKIFTHSLEDPHPDHSGVARFCLRITKRTKTIEVYTFDIWNPFNFKQSNAPKMYVDITNTFKKKMQALKIFKSQRLTMIFLLGGVIWSAIFNGMKNHTKFSEVFIKIK